MFICVNSKTKGRFNDKPHEKAEIITKKLNKNQFKKQFYYTLQYIGNKNIWMDDGNQ